MSKIDTHRVLKAFEGCTACDLHKQAHSYVIFRGNIPCQVLCIGEAPGNDEDLVGEPFVGRAGDLLDELLSKASCEIWDNKTIPSSVRYHSRRLPLAFSIGITNIVHCRPLDEERNIRPPTKEEATACSGRLKRLIMGCKPEVIILLGSVAKKHYKIQKGLDEIPSIELKHPAYVLRQGGEGSYEYNSDCLRLVEFLEEHLYGKKEGQKALGDSRKKKPKKRSKSQG